MEENNSINTKDEEIYRFDITREFIQNLPLSGYNGDISVIDLQEKVYPAIKKIREFNMIGFDTESRPSFRKGEKHPISLIQIATDEKVYLFRVNKTGMTDEIRRLIGDKRIIKIGVGLRQELGEIFKNKRPTEGFMDLEIIAKNNGFKKRGVRALAAHFLGIRVSKSAQTTNWEREHLTRKQIGYAATDAWVCLEIYRKMLADDEIEIIID